MNKSNIVVFSDFDGTITQTDVIGKLLSIYANKKWEEIEEKWIKGEIGSMECLTRQLQLLKPITLKALDDIIGSISIDLAFLDFYKYLVEKNIPIYILSDGFDLFISSILKKYKLNNIPFFSNSLEYKQGKLIPSFPSHNQLCQRKSGLCKCNKLSNLANNSSFKIYIGDGYSDICVSDKVDLLFAKGNLANYCNKNSVKHEKFNSFEDILNLIARKGEFINDDKDFYQNFRRRN